MPALIHDQYAGRFDLDAFAKGVKFSDCCLVERVGKICDGKKFGKINYNVFHCNAECCFLI